MATIYFPLVRIHIPRHTDRRLCALSPCYVRTAALVALAACSAALSGASPPAAGDWHTAAGLRAACQEWGTFLAKGLALDLLARHFQGFESALACM